MLRIFLSNIKCFLNSGGKKIKKIDLKIVLPSIITSILIIVQIGLGIILLPQVNQLQILAYIGVGFYIFSGLIFGMLPILEFQKKGRVKMGKSYIHTTRLVDTGIYSIVRHPQYITFIIWSFSAMLLFQHWIVVILGIPIILLTYIDLLNADKEGIIKFGDDYRNYMKRVPRSNFLLGFIRILIDKNNKRIYKNN